jgi:hypothetical protein
MLIKTSIKGASAHPVCEVCTRKGFKERLRKKTLLGKRKT